VLTMPIINQMSKIATSRPRYGREIAARRAQLGKSGTDIINETDGIIYPKLLSRIETGVKDPREITVTQMSALLRALDWTAAEFERVTGMELGQFKQVHPGEAPTSFMTSIPGGLQLVSVVATANGGRPSEYAIPVKRDLVRPATRAFHVEGSSMDDGTEDGIRDGDWVLVNTSLTELENGKVYLIEIIGDGMTIKRLRRAGPDWLFLPDNPAGHALRLNEARVIGQVYAKVSYGKVR